MELTKSRRSLALGFVLSMVAALLIAVPAPPAEAADDHLQLSEIVVTPTAGEYVEIYNPTDSAIDLTDYYLTDATFAGGSQYYYNIVTGVLASAGGGGFADFHARFPTGATIASGEYQTISLTGSDAFFATYGIDPTYELFEDGAAADAVPDMLEALPGSINSQGGLSNDGEFVVIYTWDGASDLVTDVDYALWGDKAEAVDKTGVAVDGPDADTDTSTYRDDTAIGDQDVIDTGGHAGGDSFQRIDLTEGTEIATDGNGPIGDDETSENLSATWGTLAATPGEGVPTGPGIIVNEIDYDQDGTDAAEFVELANASLSPINLSGYQLRFVNGSGGSVYDTIVLPAIELAAGDYFVVCANAATVPNCDLDDGPDTNFIQNGAPDAVALFNGAALVDTVSYEGDTLGFTEGSGAGLEDDPGFNARGISRFPDRVDTDQNNVDLSPRCITPGLPNGEADSDCGEAVDVITTFGACGDPATPISAIQGTGPVSPVAGAPGEGAVVEGVVVGDFEAATELSGFFVQEEDTEADGDDDTSDGIFVYNAGFGPGVAAGDVVRVKGDVVEFFGLTEINDVTQLEVCGTDVASAASVTLPVATMGDWEAVEGMLITITQTLYASGNFTQGRFGEVDLSVNGPLDNPTNVVAPGAPALALQDLNDRSRIQLDDGSTVENPTPTPYIGSGGTLRTGDTLPGITGILSYSFGVYELHPTGPVTFTRANVRPDVPAVGGSIQVAAYNVLNYFTTIDTGAPVCGPLADQGCRGADSTNEFDDQRAKIVAAIAQLDAAVVGLMEIENAFDNTPEANLVDGLNDATAPGTYDYIETPGGVGGDAIRVALLYQPGEVTPMGAPAILDSSVDPTFNDARNRAMLIQTFRENSTGAVFSVAVNHLKSKGSDCNAEGDPDAGDGQGNCNMTRTTAAQAIVNYLASDPTGSGDPDFLIIGDLNAYAEEDPVTAIEAAGYTDLIERFVGTGFAEGAYSYNFFSQSGYLDHGLSSPTMTPQVSGASFWHVNADEPSALDYNDYNPPSLLSPDEFRSSDHDPVIIGLAMEPTMPTAAEAKQSVVDDLSGLLPTGDKADDKRIERAIELLEASLNPDYWADGNYLTEDGKKVFGAERLAVMELGKVAGMAAGTASDAINTIVMVDEGLAQRAIDIAVATGGMEIEIGKALSEMDKAAEAFAMGNADGAVLRYRLAWDHATRAIDNVRFATFNASMNRFNAGDLVADLASPGSAQPATIAEIIQRTRPEVLLINEFDYDAGGVSAQLFQDNYLSVGQSGADPIEYPFHYVAPSNTGVPSGFDLNNDGTVGGADDAFGFGFFPGQYGMVVYSMFPIDLDEVRTFQNFLWKDMPGALLPELDGESWYSDEELAVFRLSSKSHWDLPIVTGDERMHFLVSHPTPPVFDGPEDRNGTRNFDEIRFWADYVHPGRSGYIYDDDGKYGGLGAQDLFVIAGDQNSDPLDGDSIPGAIQQLLEHPKVSAKMTPSSEGAVEQAALQGGANDDHQSDPAFDTADFSDSAPGNLRADYVLPRKNMKITDSGVFWPLSSDPLFRLVGTFPFPSSDHRLVWVDIAMR